MTTYRIKQSSPWLFITTLLGVIFAGMAILLFLSSHHFLPKGITVFVLTFIPIIGLAFYLPRFTATADIEINLDNLGFERKWIRQFIFHNKQDIQFQWSEIADYVVEPDKQFDQFKLHLKDGTKFRFYHNNVHNNKDDFRRFLYGFRAKVDEINSDKDKSNDIKLGKTIYETTWGLVLAGFAIMVMIGFPILLFALPTKRTPNYGMIGVAYVGAIYFLIQVYIHRQKKKEP